MSRLRVVVVGSEETRDALVKALESALPDVAVSAFASHSVARGDAMLRARHADALVLDLVADPEARLTALARITATHEDVVAFAVYDPLRVPPELGEARLCRDAVRAGARDLLRLPFSPDEVGPAFRRTITARDSGPGLEREGKVVAVISPKGGVGKTTVAVSLAIALAGRFPDDVVLVDASLQTGTAGHLLDLSPERSLVDAAEAGDRLDGELLDSILVRHEPSTLRLLATPGDVGRAAALTEEGLTNVVVALRERYRYVVIDTFPLVNSINLAAIDLADRTLLVVEAVVPTLKETRHFVDLLREAEVDAENLHLVLNRFIHGPGNVAPELASRAIGLAIEAILPQDPELLTAANEGRPLLLSHPRRPFPRAIATLAAAIAGVEAPREGLLARVFGSLLRRKAPLPAKPAAPEEEPTVVIDDSPAASAKPDEDGAREEAAHVAP